MNSRLEIQVFDNSSKNLIGSVTLNLNDYKDQKKKEEILSLKSISGKEEGKIRIRLRVMWSKIEFFQSQINFADSKLKMAANEMKEVAKYLVLLEEPFGLILYGEIENIMMNDVLEVPKEKEEILNKQRMSINPTMFETRTGNNTFQDRIDNVIKGTFSKLIFIQKRMLNGAMYQKY